ncbi:MAG: hypothetical protein NC218_07535 [Acetobacter sp.]|nr:hypothetical protein [Acetobacter sp.]
MDKISSTSIYTNNEGNEVYSTSTLKEQLAFLEAMNYNMEELAKWKDDLYNDGDSAMNTQSLQDIADAVANCNE